MRSDIWIRKENEETWRELESKSEFVNTALLKHATGSERITETRMSRRNVSFCEHGAAKGLCKKGCK